MKKFFFVVLVTLLVWGPTIARAVADTSSAKPVVGDVTVAEKYLKTFKLSVVRLFFSLGTTRCLVIGGTDMVGEEQSFIGCWEDTTTGFVVIDLKKDEIITQKKLPYVPQRIWVDGSGHLVVVGKERWGRELLTFIDLYEFSYDEKHSLNHTGEAEFYLGVDRMVDFHSQNTRVDGENVHLQVKPLSAESGDDSDTFVRTIPYKDLMYNPCALYISNEDVPLNPLDRIEERKKRETGCEIALLGIAIAEQDLRKKRGENKFENWDTLSNEGYIPQRFISEGIGNDYAIDIFDKAGKGVNIVAVPTSLIFHNTRALAVEIGWDGKEIIRIVRFRGKTPDFRKWYKESYLLHRAEKDFSFSEEYWHNLDMVKIQKDLQGRCRLTLRALGTCQLAANKDDPEKGFGRWDQLLEGGYIDEGFSSRNTIWGYSVITLKTSNDRSSRVVMMAIPLDHASNWPIYAVEVGSMYATKGDPRICYPEMYLYKFIFENEGYPNLMEWIQKSLLLDIEQDKFPSLRDYPDWWEPIG